MHRRWPTIKLIALTAVACLLADFALAQRVRPVLRPVSLFPLEVGTYWVYERRGAAGSSTWRVEVVGDTTATNGRNRLGLAGYFPGPVRHVRVMPLDVVTEIRPDGGRDALWYLLRAPVDLPWRLELATEVAPMTGGECIDGSRLHVGSRDETLKVPAGEFGAVVRVDFESRCADAGITAEYFAPGVGLIRREETSLAGAVVSELVESNAGGLKPARQPYTTSLSLDRVVVVNNLMPSPDPARLPEVSGALTVRNDTNQPLVLEFAGCRSVLIEVRNGAGEVVLTGHADDGGCCTCSSGLDVTLLHSAVTLPFTITLVDADQRPLPDGVYAITVSFILTELPVLRPSATAHFEIRSVY